MKFLIVKFSAIGDCVISVPVAASVRRFDRSAEICWAVEPRCAPVVEVGRLASRLALMDRERWRTRRWSPRLWREQMAAFSRLRADKFDFGIDLQGHSKTAICLRLARPAKRIASLAFDPMCGRLNPIAKRPPDGTPMVERHLLALRELGEFSAEPRWIMPSLISERAHVTRSDKPLVTISVGAGHYTKVYPRDQWAEIATQLLLDGFRVVFLGGGNEMAPAVAGAEDLAGKIPLAESMAWVAESDIHLAADTGSGHIAAAYGTPVVTIFGPKDPRVFAPYTQRRVVLRKSVRPGDVAPAEVVEAAKTLLTKDEPAIST